MGYGEGLDMPGVSDLALAWGHEGTRTDQGSRIIYITKKPNRQHAQSTILGLFVEANLFRLTGWFHIHLFIYLSYSKAQGRKDFWKSSKPCHVGIHWIAPADHFVLAKLATTIVIYKGLPSHASEQY